jgi:hypothetical protein
MTLLPANENMLKQAGRTIDKNSDLLSRVKFENVRREHG